MNACVYLLEAKYLDGFRVFVRFNTGEAGAVDLHDVIFKHKAAAPLQSPQSFADFHLDSWPTLAWKCGFDIAPETLLARLTGSA